MLSYDIQPIPLRREICPKINHKSKKPKFALYHRHKLTSDGITVKTSSGDKNQKSNTPVVSVNGCMQGAGTNRWLPSSKAWVGTVDPDFEASVGFCLPWSAVRGVAWSNSGNGEGNCKLASRDRYWEQISLVFLTSQGTRDHTAYIHITASIIQDSRLFYTVWCVCFTWMYVLFWCCGEHYGFLRGVFMQMTIGFLHSVGLAIAHIWTSEQKFQFFTDFPLFAFSTL
jgi:hypothetical protein